MCEHSRLGELMAQSQPAGYCLSYMNSERGYFSCTDVNSIKHMDNETKIRILVYDCYVCTLEAQKLPVTMKE